MRRFWLAAILGLIASLLLVDAAQAASETRVAVFLINWPDDTSQPITTSRVNDEMFVLPGSVAAFYTDTSYGQEHLSGDVLGWYTVGALKSAGCAASTWALDARNQATAQGFDPAAYDTRIYMWKSAGCGWTGYTNGNDVYINYLQSGIHESTVAHELGHVIGFGHAGAYICNRNGVQISLPIARGDSCEVWDYADRYDTMGNSSFYGFNAIHRSMAGWLPTSDTQAITAAGDYSLVPLEWSSGIRQLEIVPPRQGNNPPPWHLCIEVRQSFGWDQFFENGQYGNPWATRGVHVHQMPSCLTDSQGSLGSGKTYLIDGTPTGITGMQTLDTPLPAGQALVGEGVTITVLGIDTNGASVQITYPKGKH